MIPASGNDALHVRHAYLRKRHARRSGNWRRTAIWVGMGIIACCVCVVGIGGLIVG